MDRRGLLLGVAGLFCAPAIIRVSSLMSIKEIPNPVVQRWIVQISDLDPSTFKWVQYDLTEKIINSGKDYFRVIYDVDFENRIIQNGGDVKTEIEKSISSLANQMTSAAKAS